MTIRHLLTTTALICSFTTLSLSNVRAAAVDEVKEGFPRVASHPLLVGTILDNKPWTNKLYLTENTVTFSPDDVLHVTDVHPPKDEEKFFKRNPEARDLLNRGFTIVRKNGSIVHITCGQHKFTDDPFFRTNLEDFSEGTIQVVARKKLNGSTVHYDQFGDYEVIGSKGQHIVTRKNTPEDIQNPAYQKKQEDKFDKYLYAKKIHAAFQALNLSPEQKAQLVGKTLVGEFMSPEDVHLERSAQPLVFFSMTEGPSDVDPTKADGLFAKANVPFTPSLSTLEIPVGAFDFQTKTIKDPSYQALLAQIKAMPGEGAVLEFVKNGTVIGKQKVKSLVSYVLFRNVRELWSAQPNHSWINLCASFMASLKKHPPEDQAIFAPFLEKYNFYGLFKFLSENKLGERNQFLDQKEGFEKEPQKYATAQQEYEDALKKQALFIEEIPLSGKKPQLVITQGEQGSGKSTVSLALSSLLRKTRGPDVRICHAHRDRHGSHESFMRSFAQMPQADVVLLDGVHADRRSMVGYDAFQTRTEKMEGEENVTVLNFGFGLPGSIKRIADRLGHPFKPADAKAATQKVSKEYAKASGTGEFKDMNIVEVSQHQGDLKEMIKACARAIMSPEEYGQLKPADFDEAIQFATKEYPNLAVQMRQEMKRHQEGTDVELGFPLYLRIAVDPQTFAQSPASAGGAGVAAAAAPSPLQDLQRELAKCSAGKQVRPEFHITTTYLAHRDELSMMKPWLATQMSFNEIALFSVTSIISDEYATGLVVEVSKDLQDLLGKTLHITYALTPDPKDPAKTLMPPFYTKTMISKAFLEGEQPGVTRLVLPEPVELSGIFGPEFDKEPLIQFKKEEAAKQAAEGKKRAEKEAKAALLKQQAEAKKKQPKPAGAGAAQGDDD